MDDVDDTTDTEEAIAVLLVIESCFCCCCCCYWFFLFWDKAHFCAVMLSDWVCSSNFLSCTYGAPIATKGYKAFT